MILESLPDLLSSASVLKIKLEVFFEYFDAEKIFVDNEDK